LKTWRLIIIVVVGGVALSALILPEVLARRAESLAMTTVRKVFDTPVDGSYSDALAKSLINAPAVRSLKGVGDGSGKFQLQNAYIKACQASGVPCIVYATLVQNGKEFRFRFDVFWGDIEFAGALDANEK